MNVPGTVLLGTARKQERNPSPMPKCPWVERVLLYRFITSCGLMLPEKEQWGKMEKKAVPEGQVTVLGHLVTYQSPGSACFRFLSCGRVHPQLTFHIPGA